LQPDSFIFAKQILWRSLAGLAFAKRAALFSAPMVKSVSLAQVALIAMVLALAGCATEPPLFVGPLIKGIPRPNQWKKFLAQAEHGQIEEVRDDTAEPSIGVHLMNYQFGPVGATRSTGATSSEIFKGKFRPEAKTSYARIRKEKTTDIDTLLNALPTDAQMTQQHHELVAKDSNHQNHVPRIAEEKRSVTVNAWLYWVSRQSDDDYHLILGDTSELSSKTLFMNAEISGLPPDKPTRQPFVRLRDDLRKMLATTPNKNGAFIHPVTVRITGSLLWDGEHRNPHNVGPKKPVNLRPKKAWEIHPIRVFVH
jgi:hypothetical protein